MGRPKLGDGETLAAFLQRITVEGDTDCIVWTGHLTSRGYGLLSVGRGSSARAHRWFWEWNNGPVPEGLVLDHLCRNKRCVNPDHLEPVTSVENLRRHFSLRTHCAKGHELTEYNTVSVNVFGRICRLCRTASRGVKGKYTRMTGEEVDQILAWLAEGKTKKDVVALSGRSKGTIDYVAKHGKRDWASRIHSLPRTKEYA